MERAFGLWSHPRSYVLGERAGKQTAKTIWTVVAIMMALTAILFFRHVESKTAPYPVINSLAVAPNEPAPALAPLVSAPQPAIDKELESLIAAWVAKYPAQQWSVVVEDLAGNRTASYNAQQQYDPASIYKLFAVYAFAQKVPVSTWATTRTLNGTGNHTYTECIDAMLRLSDNPCGEALAGQIGWSYIDNVNRQAGFTSTALNRQHGMVSTAADTAAMLKRLEQGNLVSSEVRDLMLASLKNQKYRAGIPAGCSGCEVFNKTGERDDFRHDAAIIHSNGKSYVLAIFSQNGSNAQIAELTRLINSYISNP